MKKISLILILVSTQLFSNILCRQKIAKELVLLPDGYPSWVINKYDTLTFSPFVLKDVNVTKRNPLIGLSIIHHNQPLENTEKMILRKPRHSYRFAIDDEIYIEGNITKPQIGLDFAHFSQFIPDNIMIVSGCCVTSGLSIGGDKFIDGDYIREFIDSKKGHFADVGARFKEENNSIFVDVVNPFFTNNPFLEGDEILYLNDEPVENLKELLKSILFSPIHETLKFEVLRDNNLVTLSVETAILKGGGLLSDTFLENIGVWFDEDLYVVNVHGKSAFAKKGLRNNYQLIKINGNIFKTAKDIREFLSNLKEHMPDKFRFIFKHKNGELTIELKSNKKFFKNIQGDSFNLTHFSFGGANALLTTSSSNNFQFGDSWHNYEKSTSDINNSFYDIYNQLPLAEYLSY